MPRSINSVAFLKQEEKKILKQAKGYFGRRKNVYTVAKMQLRKHYHMHTVIEKLKNVLELFGFKESMQELGNMECHILSLWVFLKKAILI